MTAQFSIHFQVTGLNPETKVVELRINRAQHFVQRVSQPCKEGCAARKQRKPHAGVPKRSEQLALPSKVGKHGFRLCNLLWRLLRLGPLLALAILQM
jgi:hypothetical protein